MSTTGTWNIGGYNLPDYSVTEKIASLFGSQGSTQPTTLYNPLAGVTGQIGPAQTPTPIYGPEVPSGYVAPTNTQGIVQPTSVTQTQPTQQTTQSGSAPAEIDYEALYSPLLQALAGQESTASTEYQNTLTDLEKQKTGALGDVTDTAADQQKTLAGQRTDVDLSKQSALKQARKLYNELSQNISARYGSGNSIGPAMSEILARSTNENFGNVEQTAQRAFQDIVDKSFEVDRFAKKEATRISDEYDSIMRQAGLQYQQRIDAINAQRGNLESDKMAKRYAAMQERQAQISAMEQWRLQAQISLSSWTDAQKSQLSSSLASFPQAFSSAWTTGNTGTISQAPVKIAQSVAGTNSAMPAADQTLASYYTQKAKLNPMWNASGEMYQPTATGVSAPVNNNSFANIG